MTENKIRYNKHFLMLSILFTLGNACIISPSKNADEFNYLGFLTACVVALFVCLCTCFLPINKITVFPIWTLAIYCFFDAFLTFIRFISANLLPESPNAFIIAPFGIILIYVGFQKTDTLFKFSLICGVFSIFVIAFFFFSTAKDFKLHNIYIYELPDGADLWRQTLSYIKILVPSSALLAIFARGEKIGKRTTIAGLGIGLFCFGLCILNSVLLFGIKLSGVLDYPYSSAGSVVTFGYLFTRLDGFLYFVYLATNSVKCAVAIFVIKNSRNIAVP